VSTAIPGTSEDLLARMDEAWKPFRRVATALGVHAIEQPTPAGWTYKEMLAHVAAWHELAARRLRAFREHGVTEPGDGPAAAARLDGLGLSDARRDELLHRWDMDAFNAGIREAAAARPAADVLRELGTSYARLRTEVEALSDEELTSHVADGRSFAAAIVEGDSFGHYAEHRDELLAAVPRTTADLVARIETGWRIFREAVRHLGRERLTRPIEGGWTYKDMLGHVAAWLEYVPARLREIRSGRPDPVAWSDDAIDAFNARAVEGRRLVGPEAILDELDTAYRRVLSEARTTTDEEVARSSHASETLSLFARCTYLHFEEHYRELGVDPLTLATPQVVGRQDLVERGLDGW
jgi:hypothetical protein